MRPRIFSGMQPTGNLHIGNYLGALKTWAAVQDDYESFFGIVDLHAITIYQDPKELKERSEQVAALYLAAGIDPEKSAIFVQSAVPAHVELGWIFTCVTPFGWLNRMTQFKSKSEKQDVVGTGLFCYPVLMAADILLYQAKIVPVGDDQSQHLELARDIAQRFNSLYGDTFIVPETKLPTVGARIMGLDDPTQKMSKSAPGTKHAVNLLDPPKRIQKLINSAKTDLNPEVDFSNMGDGVRNLLNIYQAFSGCSNDELEKEFAGNRYGDLKRKVGEMAISHIEPIQQRYHEWMDDRAQLHGVLKRSAERASDVAARTMSKVRKRVGLFQG